MPPYATCLITAPRSAAIAVTLYAAADAFDYAMPLLRADTLRPLLYLLLLPLIFFASAELEAIRRVAYADDAILRR